MSRLFLAISNKKTKYIVLIVLLILFLSSLFSLLVTWNENISFFEETSSLVNGFTAFIEKGIYYEYVVDYANVHVRLNFQNTVVLGICLILSILHLFLKNVDFDYFIRGTLFFSNSFPLIFINLKFWDKVQYYKQGIVFGFICLLISSLCFFYFVLDKKYGNHRFIVYLLNRAGASTSYLLLVLLKWIIIMQSEGYFGFFNLLYAIICAPYISEYPNSILNSLATKNYLIAPLTLAEVMLLREFVIIGIIYFVLFLKKIVKKRKIHKN